MALTMEYLVDRPEFVPLVISWWHSIWADRMGEDLEALANQLGQALSKQQLPVHVLAMLDGIPVGTAALKHQELAELYPHRQYWLGSVFVKPRHRQERIASRLAERVIELARARGLPHLHLQTLDLSGGLYGRLGWQAVEQFDYKGERALLMRRPLL